MLVLWRYENYGGLPVPAVVLVDALCVGDDDYRRVRRLLTQEPHRGDLHLLPAVDIHVCLHCLLVDVGVGIGVSR